MATQPGNGRTSPFGNGNGGASEAQMAGTDLVKDPRGNASAPKPMEVLNPKGGTPSNNGPNPASVMPGGNTAAEVTQPGQSRGGVGSIGNGQKPYKISGGA